MINQIMFLVVVK